MSKTKTILQIAALNPKKMGSFEDLMIDLSLELKGIGIKSVIVFNDEVPENLKSNYQGIDLAVLSQNKNPFKFYYQLYKIIKKYKPDIADIHFYPFFSFMTLFIFFAGVRSIIFTDHCSGEIEEKSSLNVYLSKIRTKFFMKFIKKLVCVSSFVFERDMTIPGIDPSKLTCVHYGIDLARFSSNKSNREKLRSDLFNIDRNQFVVMTAANLIKEKGIQYLIKAADILIKEKLNIIFLIVGEGVDGNEFKAEVLNLGLEKNFIFAGLRSDIDKILSISDVFIYLSVWQEAFGLAIVEAMASGVPVIATRVGGIPELIEDNVTGIIVPPNDHLTVVKALRNLYSNKEILIDMGKKSRLRTEQIFDIKTRTTKTIRIYNEYL